MSCVDVRERLRDSPDRARSLLTVRAAISSDRRSPVPRSSWLSLMCSYWRARLVPFWTPRGGMAISSALGRRRGRASADVLLVLALGELLDQLGAERRQVVRLTARDEAVVDYDFLVDP